MKTQDLSVGSRIEHAEHGSGIVTFVGTDYLGIAFDEGGEALIRRTALENDTPKVESAEPEREALPWPVSTFVPDCDGKHYLGSHWSPFAEDSTDIVKRLPDILPAALVQTGYGADRKPARAVPDAWAKGFQLVWPLRMQGFALILRIEQDGNLIVSLFPFYASGSQHTLTVREVCVWDSGLEAQITASWGPTEISFFDTQFPINRIWYEAGKDYDFILTGIAYSAQPAEKHEWKVNQHPDQVAWMNRYLKDGDEPHVAEVTMRLDGAALFMPISEWDVDDYRFHAPVKSVEPFSDWLGQEGWRVRATVLRFGDEDVDLDIVITRRAWSGDLPPQVGEDIEGQLWLQGYLWMPDPALEMQTKP